MSYGYSNQEDRKTSPMHFGLNAGTANLKEFKYIPNGGKDSAEQDALEIIFEINGVEVSAREFPVTSAFDDANNKVTDPQHPAMVKAMEDFNAKMVHIMHVFVDDETLQKALANKIESFKEYATILQGLLPNNYRETKLDLFFQYPWNPNEQGKKYLRLPQNMGQGRWISKAIAPVGSWKEVKNTSTDNSKALTYVDDAGNVHPFTRSTYFLNSGWADSGKKSNATAANGSAAPNINNGGAAAPASTW